MSLGRTLGIGLTGVSGFLVEVEAHVGTGLPAFAVSGLGDSAVKQAPDRIRAVAASVAEMPVSQRRVTVNLSPAGRRKAGTGFDLAIFVAVAAALRLVPDRAVRRVVHLGELGLDGAVRPVPGVLPALLAASRAGVRHAVVPLANAAEARLVPGIAVHPVAEVTELLSRYRDLGAGLAVVPVPEPTRDVGGAAEAPVPDLADVLGQVEAKLALEIAAAGGHHALFSGPPGAGKTMLAERLVGLLPDLGEAESMEVTAIHSVLGEFRDRVDLITRPPFVAPHHGASAAAIIGGGQSVARPGAISRAHHGVLFLDESPEFDKAVLQALRTPLERGSVTIARARETVRYPARFQLVLAANPCPCGNGWGRGADCTCSVVMRRNYFGKLSGPLLDRVDLRVQVQPPGPALAAAPPGETTAVVAARVAEARRAQASRWHGTGHRLNAAVPGPVLRGAPWRLPSSTTRGLDTALDQGHLSMRGYDRTLRTAWTIGDLAGRSCPGGDDVDLALVLRRRDGSLS